MFVSYALHAVGRTRSLRPFTTILTYWATMLRWLISCYDTWRAPMLEAERIVHQQDRAELFRLAARAADPDQPFEVRRYNARVLQIGIDRQEMAKGVDRRTRDCLYERWEGRRGSLIR